MSVGTGVAGLLAPAAVPGAPGPHVRFSVLGNIHNKFKNTHVKKILNKCLTRA